MNDQNNTIDEESNKGSATPFLYIPDYVNRVKDLKASERDVLAVIVGLSKKDGFCFVKNETLTRVAGVKSVRGVQYILKKLRNRKLIFIKITRYKKAEIKKEKSHYGTIRTISPVIGNIKIQGLEIDGVNNDKTFMGAMNPPSLNIINRYIKPNNYLKDQKISFKRNENKSNPVSLSKTQNEVVMRSMLNKLEKKFLLNLDSLREYGISEDVLKLTKDGILHYFRRYREICRTEHPIYKFAQLEECYVFLSDEICQIIDRGYSVNEIPNIVSGVFERWFSTTNTDPNNLRLSHFLGGETNAIFSNCLDAILG